MHAYNVIDVVPHQPKLLFRIQKASSITEHYNPGESRPHHLTGVKFRYDSYDNPIVIADLGDVSVTGDESYSCQQYIHDKELWRFDLISSRKAMKTDSCGDFLNWNSSTDLSWQVILYDEKYNVQTDCEWLSDPTGKSRGEFRNHDCPVTTGGQWRSVQYGYDAFGNITSQIDPLGNATKVQFDTKFHAFPAMTTYPNGLTTKHYIHPGFGSEIQRTDSNGVVTRNVLDSFGRILATYGPSPSGREKRLQVTQYLPGINGFGMQIVTHKRTSWNEDDVGSWLWTRQTLDSYGRNIREEQKQDSGKSLSVDTVYDHLGRTVEKSQPYFMGQDVYFTKKTYDWFGNIVKIIGPTGAQSDFEFRLQRLSGKAVTMQKHSYPSPTGTGAEFNLKYKDIKGNVVAVTHANGVSTKSEYDYFGRVVRTTDGRGLVSSSQYDTLGRLVSIVEPDAGKTAMFYNINNQLLKKQDANGNIFEFTYDLMGRVVTKSTTSKSPVHSSQLGQSEVFKKVETVRYQYDNTAVKNGKGRLTSVHIPRVNATYSYSYDAYGNILNQVTEYANRKFSFKNIYDPLGRAILSTFPDQSTKKIEYNEGAQIHRVMLTEKRERRSSTFANYSEYNEYGVPQRIEYANGMIAAKEFDVLGRPIKSSVARGNVSLLKHDYFWNSGNKLTNIQDHIRENFSQSFSFDRIGQLIEASGSYGKKSYGYDGNGNIREKDDLSFQHESQSNRMISSTDGSLKYTYDLNGNMLSKEKKNSPLLEFVYDAGNRMTAVKRKSKSSRGSELLSSFEYDDAGRRLSKHDSDGTVTLYISPEYEVTMPSTHPGLELHTKTLMGVNGPIATVTLDSRNLELGSVELYGGDTLQGSILLGWQKLTDLFSSGKAFNRYSLAELYENLFIFVILSSLFACGIAIQRIRTPLKDSRRIYAFIAPIVLMALLIDSLSFARTFLVPGEFGPGIPSKTKQYLYQDFRQGTALVMDENRSDVTRIEYDPFGKIVEEASEGRNNFRPKFNGHEYDMDSGFQYFGSRYYESESGRFTAPDPQRQFASSYLFAANDPLSFIDPVLLLLEMEERTFFHPPFFMPSSVES